MSPVWGPLGLKLPQQGTHSPFHPWKHWSPVTVTTENTQAGDYMHRVPSPCWQIESTSVSLSVCFNTVPPRWTWPFSSFYNQGREAQTRSVAALLPPSPPRLSLGCCCQHHFREARHPKAGPASLWDPPCCSGARCLGKPVQGPLLLPPLAGGLASGLSVL